MRVPGHFHESKNTEEDRKCKRQSTIPLALCRRVLSLLGALPCSRQSPYWPSLDWKKSNVVYSAVLLSISTAVIVWTMIQKKREYDQSDPSMFLHKVISLFTIIILFTHVMAFLLWWDVSEHDQFMKLFATIQVAFQKATGKRLENRKLALEHFATLSNLLSLPSFYCLSCYLIADLDRSLTVAYAVVYCNTVGVQIVVCWVIAAKTVTDALEDIHDELKQFLQSDKLTPRIVFEFRLMWLYLRKVCDTMSRWKALFFGYTVSLSTSIIFTYQALTFFQEAKNTVALGILSTSIFHSTIVFLICRASQGVEEKMKILVTEVLPDISLSSYSIEIQREIIMLYLIESARPGVTTFDGLLKVNHRLLLSFVSNVATYIIVFVQLSQKDR